MIHHQVTVTTGRGTKTLEFRTRQRLAAELEYWGVSRASSTSYEGTFAPAGNGVYEVTWGPVQATPEPVPAPRPSAPTVPQSEPRRDTLDPDVTAGIYRTNGTVYVVKPNKQGTRQYAKRLVEIGGQRVTDAGTFVNIDFVYEAGAIYRIAASDRLPADEAAELSVRYGRCLMCGRPLKAATSVARAIGPVCWGKIS